MTIAEIEAALTNPESWPRLYGGLTPAQASDLYNWGFR